MMNNIKKQIIGLLFSIFIFTNINAQTYAEYFNQFPLIKSQTVWDQAAMNAYPENEKPALDEKYYGLIGGKGNGKGKWGKDDILTFKPKALYPLGRVESGNCVYVFMLEVPTSYEKGRNTKKKINMFYYEKKTGNMMRGGVNFMLGFFGGEERFNFQHTGSISTDGKILTKIYSDTENKKVTTEIYKLKSSGTDMVSSKTE